MKQYDAIYIIGGNSNGNIPKTELAVDPPLQCTEVPTTHKHGKWGLFVCLEGSSGFDLHAARWDQPKDYCKARRDHATTKQIHVSLWSYSPSEVACTTEGCQLMDSSLFGEHFVGWNGCAHWNVIVSTCWHICFWLEAVSWLEHMLLWEEKCISACYQQAQLIW